MGALCPQMIGLKILNTHFTAKTWLNWSYRVLYHGQLITMLLQPRHHIMTMPQRAGALLFTWGMRSLALNLLGEAGTIALEKLGGYVTIASSIVLSALYVLQVFGFLTLLKR